MTAPSPSRSSDFAESKQRIRAHIDDIRAAIAELSPTSKHYRALKNNYERQIAELQAAALRLQEVDQTKGVPRAQFRGKNVGLLLVGALLTGAAVVCWSVLFN